MTLRIPEKEYEIIVLAAMWISEKISALEPTVFGRHDPMPKSRKPLMFAYIITSLFMYRYNLSVYYRYIVLHDAKEPGSLEWVGSPTGFKAGSARG